MTIIYAIAAISALIALHELGHFLAARAAGVAVLEFSLGFGPRLFTREFGGTAYTLSLIPVGGYVRILNEEVEEGEGPPGKPLSQASKPACLAIALAGPLANLIFSLCVYLAVAAYGTPNQTTLIGSVYPGTPAASAGILPGDRILSVGGKATRYWVDMIGAVGASEGRPVLVVIGRKGGEESLLLTPSKNDGRWVLGVKSAGEIEYEEHAAAEVVPLALSMIATDIKSALTGFAGIAGNIGQLAGPLSIVQIGSGQSKLGLIPFLLFLALLSSNLFVLNLLPIPVLDGGTILFTLWEMFFKRPVPARARQIITTAGALFVVGLMVVVLVGDGLRMFK